MKTSSAKGGQSESGVRILLGEDEGLIALDLETVLMDLGYEVVGPLSSLDEIMAAADDCDGALLDVNLRGELVYPAARRILARGVPILFSSGYGEQGKFPEEFRHVPRLIKPYDDSTLREMCRTAFGDAS